MTYVESTRRRPADNGVRATENHRDCTEPCDYDCPAHHPDPTGSQR